MTDEFRAYNWLKEKFPNQHPLGGVVGVFNYLGYEVRKYIPFVADISIFNTSMPPQQSKCIQKIWKHNDECYIIRFDNTGVYVKAFTNEETHIPFNFFKSFKIPYKK